MSEREAAVAWLEKDYDYELDLVTEEFDGEEWGESVYYWARARTEHGRGFLTVKDQNG